MYFALRTSSIKVARGGVEHRSVALARMSTHEAP
jgi:hypothetical protein